jgi:hypothetical protein
MQRIHARQQPEGMATRPVQPPAPPALSEVEQQRIAQRFPPNPTLELRLYGPNAAMSTASPAALGNRLDLSA